jgi:hypothetical protein
MRSKKEKREREREKEKGINIFFYFVLGFIFPNFVFLLGGVWRVKNSQPLFLSYKKIKIKYLKCTWENEFNKSS